MLNKISLSIDIIADRLEAKNLTKEALELDKVADELDKYASNAADVEKNIYNILNKALIDIKRTLEELPPSDESNPLAMSREYIWKSIVDKYRTLFNEKMDQIEFGYQ